MGSSVKPAGSFPLSRIEKEKTVYRDRESELSAYQLKQEQELSANTAELKPPKQPSLQELVRMELDQMIGSERKTENPADVFDALRAAQEVFRKCCYEFQKAAMKRDTANRILAEISAKAQALIEHSMHDPTDPTVPQAQASMQAGTQAMPGNGRY